MSSKPLESNLEHRVCRWAKKRRIENIKLNLQGRRNWPDRCFFILGGKPALIEFKRLGKKPRPAQAYILRTLKGLGYDVCVAETFAEAIAWLEDCVARALQRIAQQAQTPRLPKTRGRVVSITRGRRAVR
jgi:hypothetical protein